MTGGQDISALSMSDSDFAAVEDETSAVRVEPGSHEELMYTLGVNLARQLGDVRPLVESGDELAQVSERLPYSTIGYSRSIGSSLSFIDSVPIDLRRNIGSTGSIRHCCRAS
jgi:hypothetical protein